MRLVAPGKPGESGLMDPSGLPATKQNLIEPDIGV